MALFGKKNEARPAAGFRSDPRKAARFFDHARVVADSRNYDYAIECYIDGLRFDPGNIAAHESLHDAALKRRVGGGRGARLAEKFKTGGKGAVDRLLHAEMLWAKDPQNISLMVDVMTRAVEADTAHDDVQLTEVARWVGRILLDAMRGAKQPSKTVCLKTRDLFAQIGAFSEAVEASKLALRLDPDNPLLTKELKDLEAERAMQDGGFTAENITSGSFRRMVKDMDKQRQLEHADAVTVKGSAIDGEIQQRRVQYEQAPQDVDRLNKLVAALVRKESNQTEDEAIGLLGRALELTGQYQYKMKIGDLRIKQANRRLRRLQAAVKDHPDDVNAKGQLKAFLQRKQQFELAQYTERVKHYPTDVAMRFELGRRLLALHKYDEAIGAFQQAKVDPRYRVLSLECLGRCYAARGWFDESVDAVRQGIDAHPTAEDGLALRLRYQLMQSLKQLATKEGSLERAREAQKIASQVLQTDINFRDIRLQMDDIRKLVDDLAKHR